MPWARRIIVRERFAVHHLDLDPGQGGLNDTFWPSRRRQASEDSSRAVTHPSVRVDRHDSTRMGGDEFVIATARSPIPADETTR